MPRRSRREPTPRTQAALAQLRAEIAARGDGGGVKRLAADLDVDYDTLRNYITGERDLPMPVLDAALEVLGLDWETFGARVEDRLRTRPEGQ